MKHVSVNSCSISVDFVVLEGQKIRMLTLTWEQVAALVEERGQDVTDMAATKLKRVTGKELGQIMADLKL